jgi:hypothetical protein
MKMKDSKALLLEYLASVRDPEGAASLFAEDGVKQGCDGTTHTSLHISMCRSSAANLAERREVSEDH